ncbi:MAG: methyltransferase domain-containing protein [Gammaproteobacteria bacterium]|nr:methyltransferase domain-containing protein [Gammaproteobacteria bacterium]
MDKARMKAMADRVFRDVAGGMAAGLAWLGCETGLFSVLAERGPLGFAALAEASGLVPRYVEEWARGMVAAGYLDYDPAAETVSLPAEHAWLLASDGTDHYMGGLFGMVPPLMAVAPRIRTAFREGGGVPFADFPPECRHAIDLMNRGNYEHRLAGYWLQQLPDTVARLEAGGRVLDLGCGNGQVVVALARAFPASTIVGVDPDAASIAQAHAAVADAGVGANTELVQATLDAVPLDPPYDLVTACDCLHDLPDPVGVLRDVRARLAPDGVLLAIEPRVADRLEDNVNPLAAMFYGFSVFHCTTQSMAHDGAALGACLGPTRTRALFAEAGFSRVDEVDVRSPVNLFYAVRA